MKLLVDIGNTRLKAALWDGRNLRPLGATVHAGAAAPIDFVDLWKDAESVDAAAVASVAAPGLEQQLRASIAARFGVEPTFVASPGAACGVRNAYAEPARLGVDRFLALVAVHAESGVASVVAGCGTALTLDAMAADGTHLGGLIAPSPALMLDALTGATARLELPRGASVSEIADNTTDAMESGAWLAATALVERFVAAVAQRLGTAPRLTLTGGGAERLAPLIAVPARIQPDLVLRGLAIYSDTAA